MEENAGSQVALSSSSSQRVSARLLVKRNRGPETGPQPEEPPSKARKTASLSDSAGLSPGAIRSRRFRENMKADPERYATFKQKEKERFRKIRQNWTEEQKNEKNKANLKRVHKCREKKKEKGEPLNKTKSKPATRAAILEEREKERKRKAEYRSHLSPHQKAWINRKRRQKNADKKARENEKKMQGAAETATNTTEQSTGYRNSSTKRKAVKKAFSVLPADPEKYADVVNSLTDVKSPRKRRALINKGVLPSSARKQLKFAQDLAGALETKLKESKKARNKRQNGQRQMLCHILGKYSKYPGFVSQMARLCGTSRKFVKKCAADGDVKRKIRKDAISEATVQDVQKFFQRGDISRDDPSKSSVSARTGEPSRFMEKTLKEAYEQFSAENQARTLSFSKFSKLRPPRTKTMKHNPMKSCGCEYCTNVQLEVDAVNNFLLQNGHGDLTLGSKFGALDLTLCPKVNGLHKPLCISRECTHCGVQGLRQKLQAVLDSKGDAIVSWNNWKICKEEFQQRDGTIKTVSRRKYIVREGPFDELISELENDLKPFSTHIFNSTWQHQQFASLKDNLPPRWLLLVMDFAENYTCSFQDEVQGVHWARSQVTIHPIVAFFHCQDDDETVRESFMIISNDLTHDSHAVHYFSQKVVEQLLGRGLTFERIIHFSDGCPSQYKGRTSFVDLSFAEVDSGIPLEKHFFGSRHGKGPCDAEIGVLKRYASHAVKRRAAVIDSAHDLFSYGKKALTKPNNTDPTLHCHNRRTFIFVALGEILRQRPERQGAAIRTLPGTRTLHSFRSVAPYIVSTRTRSCFCSACCAEEGQCMNDAHCGQWSIFRLLKRNRDAVEELPANEGPAEGRPVNNPQRNDDGPAAATGDPPADSPQPAATGDPPAHSPQPAVAGDPPDDSPQPAATGDPPADSPQPAAGDPPAYSPQPAATGDDNVELDAGGTLPTAISGWVQVTFATVGRKSIKKQYHGVVMESKPDSLKVKFMRQRGNFYTFPDEDDIAWVPVSDVTQVNAPNVNSRGHHFF